MLEPEDEGPREDLLTSASELLRRLSRDVVEAEEANAEDETSFGDSNIQGPNVPKQQSISPSKYFQVKAANDGGKARRTTAHQYGGKKTSNGGGEEKQGKQVVRSFSPLMVPSSEQPRSFTPITFK